MKLDDLGSVNRKLEQKVAKLSAEMSSTSIVLSKNEKMSA